MSRTCWQYNKTISDMLRMNCGDSFSAGTQELDMKVYLDIADIERRAFIAVARCLLSLLASRSAHVWICTCEHSVSRVGTSQLFKAAKKGRADDLLKFLSEGANIECKDEVCDVCAFSCSFVFEL